MTSYTTTHGN